MKQYYITTPIYYANGRPHLGNTYSTALCDSLRRFYNFLGYETFFLTGTDEHGEKVEQAAVAVGKTPLQFTDEVSDLFKNTWKELDLRFNRFIRTTESVHKAIVQAILVRIHAKGDIYFGEYGGLYCLGCERFLTEKELVDGKCPDHKTTPNFVKEKNYFFKMSKYQDQLRHYLTETKPDFIRPERYKNEVLGMLREPLEDLCISRPKSRLKWGIDLPFDNNYVAYVWFDALINYLSGVDYPEGDNYKKFWPAAEHLIAKDILKPHGVFWPLMLMAAEIPLYQHLNVHGYWLTPSGKMSKSLGNVVDPLEIKQKFGMDTYRYYVFREMTFGLDGVFDGDKLETRYNTDLANNLGNLVSRTLAMLHKYRDGTLPTSGDFGELESALKENALTLASDVADHIKRMEINKAMDKIWELIDASNVYIDRTKPWELAKKKAESELDNFLYCMCDVIRIVASVLSSFLPNTSIRILSFLGFEDKALEAEQTYTAAACWGRLKAGSKLKKGEVLFPRTDRKASETP